MPKAAGSSPRGRGKPALTITRPGALGLIPAWAGKTRAGDTRVPDVAAHPRVGGENVVTSAVGESGIGSSPRGRGKQSDAPTTPPNAGLIPAWAGKTLSRRGDGLGGSAHPRVGGENHSPFSAPASSVGSSPRGRGKRRGGLFAHVDEGLIPAWAGKTIPALVASVEPGAHPRVGGENTNVRKGLNALAGSSPRGRGKPPTALSSICRFGLIPAWAGKTWRVPGAP